MKRFLLFILISGVITSCTEVLDKGPLDEVTEDQYWTTVTDLELYINQFYPSLGRHLAYYQMDNHSDNLQLNSPSSVLNGSRSVPESGGGWEWDNIRDINYFIENAPNVTEGDQADLDQYIGEGYFFRAYFYFQKVQRFGDVPLFDEVLNTDSEGLQAPRDPRNVVVDSILADLDRSIELLREKSQLPANRVNRESALLFKSRVALYEGTWEKYHAGTEFGVEGSDGRQYLQIAAETANLLIESGAYGIYSTGNPDSDYWQLFNQTDLSDNEEVILSVVVDPSMDLGTFSWSYLNGQRSASGSGVTKQLVDSYLDEEGKPISVSDIYQGDTTIVQVVQNRDPRLKQTIWVPGTVRLDYGDSEVIFENPALVGGDATSTGYMVRKGSTTDPDQNAGTSSDELGATDGIIFRYAEALLNYAEAKAELGTLTQADLDKSVNLLRERAGIAPLNINVGHTDPNWNFPDLSPIINEIRRERRVELALEGYRFDDLMRWAAGDLIQGMKLKGARFIRGESFPGIQDRLGDIKVDENRYIWHFKNSVPNGFEFDKTRDYLYPIPTNELTLNENLTQNPGW